MQPSDSITFLGEFTDKDVCPLPDLLPQARVITRRLPNSRGNATASEQFESSVIMKQVETVATTAAKMEQELYIVMSAMPSVFSKGLVEAASLYQYFQAFPCTTAIASDLQYSSFALKSIPFKRKVFILRPTEYFYLWSRNPIAERMLIELSDEIDLFAVLDDTGANYLRELGIHSTKYTQISSIESLPGLIDSSPQRNRTQSLSQLLSGFIEFMNRAIADAAVRKDREQTRQAEL